MFSNGVEIKKFIKIAEDMLQKQSIKLFKKDHLKEELTKIKERKNNLSEIYSILVDSLTNKAYWSGIHDILGRYEFDVENNLCHYSPEDVLKIGKEKLINRFRPLIQNENKLNQFIRGCLDGANFLIKFKDAKAFYDYIDNNSNTVETRWELAKSISEDIYGMGVPIACDFLIGVGATKFSKPDRHIKSILRGLKFLPPPIDEDKEAFSLIDRIAKESAIEPIEVDKMFWIIGSGKWSVDKHEKHSSLEKEYLKTVHE